jgi:hypothetical protein
VFPIPIVLWPLFHYVLWGEVTNGSAENQYWDDYVKVNQEFTDAIVSVYKPGDIGNYLFVLESIVTSCTDLYDFLPIFSRSFPARLFLLRSFFAL